jgi:PTS system N-acetylglucosamine-specific IIC component
MAGIMGSAALVSFVTGVTEPLEFAFVYVAYPLYVIHALLTGTSLALVNALGIRDGFGFSAGAIDYLLNFRIAERPLLLLLVGAGYAVVYYFLFRFVITKWQLRTPGREDDDAAVGLDPTADRTDDVAMASATTSASPATSTTSATSATSATAPKDDAGPAPDAPATTR